MSNVVAVAGSCPGGTDDNRLGELAMPQQLCPGSSFLNCFIKLILFFSSWLSALSPRRGRQQQQSLHDKENPATLTSENFI